VTATSGLPPAPAAGGLLARRRIAIARFGADVAAAGGIGPALAAGLDPADYPVVPGGVPQAWERAPGLPGAMRAVPGAIPGAGGRIAPADGNGAGTRRPAARGRRLTAARDTGAACLPLSHRRPLTDPRLRRLPVAEPVQATARPASAGWTDAATVPMATRANVRLLTTGPANPGQQEGQPFRLRRPL
jgi:hypothetical protein